MRHPWKRFRSLIALACIPIVATCGDGTTSIEDIIFSIAVTPGSPVLTSIGATQQFSATARGSSGETLSGKTFTWTSSATGVITIDQSTGLATSVGSGTATITATSEGVSGTATLTVSQEVTSVSVSAGSTTLTALGATEQLTADPQDGSGSSVAGLTAIWASSNEAVATVSASGLVTAIANGTATITATVDGIDGTLDITVAQTASGLVITQQPTSVGSSGMALNPQPVLQLQDANGNNVAQASVAVTASIATGGGTLSGTLTVNTDVNGTATFTDLVITGTSGTRTLGFAATSLTGATSSAIAIGSGNTDASQSTASVSVNTTAGTAATITVIARDAVGSQVTSGGEIVGVTVTGANGATPGVTDNGNGTYTASYTPTVKGTDNIAITINGTPIGNSPIFTIVVPAALNGATSTASITGAPAGSATSITIQGRDQFGNAQDLGGGTVLVAVTGANTSSPAVTDNANGTYSATYTPTTAGNDNISITINGIPITGSPFTNPIVPGALNPAQSTAVVPGGGLAGGTTAMTITGRDANGNAVTTGGATVVVTVSGANSGTPSVTDNGNGTYSASYSPTVAGTDNIAITMNGTPISGSPFTSLIGTGTADPAQSTATVPNGTAGAATTVTVQARDGSGNALTTGGEAVTIAVTGANTASPVVTDNGNGTYSASYTPTASGTDNLAIAMNGIAIGGGPYTSTVAPAAIDPAQSTASVPAGTAGAATSIVVTARDALGNPLATGGATTVVTVTGANAATPAVTDNSNGTYTASYTPTATGTDNVVITVNGVGISGSPFSSVVSPGAADPSTATASVPAAGTAGVPTNITVTARDANGNITSGGETVAISVAGANTATPAVTDNADGTHTASYTPTTTGTDNITITLNGVAITGSPFSSTVAAGGVDATQSTATVPGAGTAGAATAMTVQARDAAGNALATGGETVVVNVTGANTGTPTVTDNGDGTYSASYTPTTAGTDNVAITLNGVAISGSPFTSNVVPGSADPTQSTATVPANGEAAVATNITVTIRDANGNQLAAGGETVAVGVTGANTASPAVTDNADGTYSTSYTPTATGTDNIAITLNGTPINGSPFTSIVGAGGADAAQTTATVSANLTAGTASNIVVTARDGSGNALTTGGAIVVVTVTGANASTPTVTDNGDGTYATSYTPTVAGTDNVAITLNGVAIGGSPYTTIVAAGVADPAASTITAPAMIESGGDSTITITVRDANGNQVASGGATVVLFVTGVNPPSSPPVSDVGDGTYTATYTPSLTGVDQFDATINGVNIGGGPYTTTVIAGAVNAAQTTAVVPASGAVGAATNITIQAKDGSGNNRTTGGDTVVVSVTGANTVTPAVTDNGDGTYSTSYTPTAAGSDNIAITLNAAAINSSPFTSVVGAGAADPAQSTATVPAGTVGVATALSVQAVDGTGTPLTTGGEIVVITVSGANTATPTVTDNADGTYTASYTPTLAGTDNVAITMNSAAISGSPFSSVVSVGGASAANSYAIVPNGTIGTATSIFVQARDAGDNDITTGGATVVVTVTGANSASPAVTDNGDGTYTASYTPTANGTDDIEITLDAGAIFGSSYTSEVSAIPTLSGRISYESDADGNYDVWIINEDGTDPINLTNNLFSSDERPHISPDGTKIVFNSDRDGDQDIYVMNSNGSGVVQLTDNPGRDRLPVWSPDGTQILFLSEEGGDSDILVMNADGSSQTNLTNNIVDDFQADWSPDASQIVFYRGGDVWIMNADGSSETNLTPGTPSSADIETSWGSGGIAFISDRDGVANGSSEVYTIQSDGTGLTRITDDTIFDFIPSWSSDGRITWITERDGSGFRGEVWIMNSDGTGGVRVTNSSGAEWAPKFQY